ncbi:unnamed protein product [Ixodes persulcatus]
MAEWDLTYTVGQYIDRHMVFPLLEFLQNKNIYDEDDLIKAKLGLLGNTKMVDFNIEVFQMCYPNVPVPQEMTERRAEVVHDFMTQKVETLPLIEACQDEKTFSLIQSSRDSRQTLDLLMKNFSGIRPEMVDSLYKYAKLQYESGNYSGAGECLYLHRFLISPQDPNYLNNLWGKLGSEILMQNWELALDELTRLREYIDQHNFPSALQSLQQRTWLIHWSLFVFFNHTKGRDLIIDLFLMQPQNKTFSLSRRCKIIRFVNVKLLCFLFSNCSSSTPARPTITIIFQLKRAFHHSFSRLTSFFESIHYLGKNTSELRKSHYSASILYHRFSCQVRQLTSIAVYFLRSLSRVTQCRLAKVLMQQLNEEKEEVNSHAVLRVRSFVLCLQAVARCKGHVVMGTQAVSPYQQLIDKTQALLIRTQLQTSNIEHKLSASNPDRAGHWGAQNF